MSELNNANRAKGANRAEKPKPKQTKGSCSAQAATGELTAEELAQEQKAPCYYSRKSHVPSGHPKVWVVLRNILETWR